MREFNLEKALAGHPVITRDGREVTGLYKFDGITDGYSLFGVLDGVIDGWTCQGMKFSSHNDQLFMKVVKKPYTIITANDRYNFLSSKLFAEDDTYELLLVIKRWKDMGYTDIQVHVIEREE